MRALTRLELEGVLAFAQARELPRIPREEGSRLSWVLAGDDGDPWAARTARRTRFFTFLTLAVDDVEVRTVAVKRGPDGRAHAKEVVRWSALGRRGEVRDLVRQTMSGYVVDWSPEGIGRKPYWSNGGRWAKEDYWPRGEWVLDCPVVNPEVLEGSPRFRWCAWTAACGPILRYLVAYAENPRIETLAKLGLGWLAVRKALTRRLAAGGQFRRWFFGRTAEIKEAHAGAAEIFRAFRDGVGLAEARFRLAAERLFRQQGERPADAVRALAYVEGQRGATVHEYCRYLAQCRRLGLDAADTKVAYPKDFAERQADAEARCAALDRAARARGDAERRRAAAAFRRRLAEAARAWQPLERLEMYGVRAVVPRREADFRREGKLLAHCVGFGGYAAGAADGKTLVLFLRRADKPGEPWVTAEIAPDGAEVRQCYGKKNGKAEEAALAFAAGPLLKAVRRIARQRAKAAKAERAAG